MKNLLRVLIYRLMNFNSPVRFKKRVNLDLGNNFEGFNVIGKSTTIMASDVGRATYIGANCVIRQAKIGRFCSIGSNVQICLGRHPYEFVSTHPSFFSLSKQAGFTFADEQLYKEHSHIDSEEKFVVGIGNDVWVGNNVIIMDGVEIGNGAVIGSGSIVTKNVSPYQIVGGVPARVIKSRFTQAQVDQLQRIRWWNWSFEELRCKRRMFSDLDEFLEGVDGND